MRKGFTIIQLLVVIMIIATLAALISPVYFKTVGRAKEDTCLNNLRQLGLSLLMYKSENGSESYYGEYNRMGLPPPANINQKNGWNTPEELWKCSSTPSAMVPSNKANPYIIHWLERVDPVNSRFAKNAKIYQENLILLSDQNHNKLTMPDMLDRSQIKLAMGLLLSGQVIRKNARGIPSEPSWWVGVPQGEIN